VIKYALQSVAFPDSRQYHWGDRLLQPLRQQTNDFDLNGRSAFVTALILTHVKTPATAALAENLYARPDPFSKAAGAAGLAGRGGLPKEVFRSGGFLNEVLMTGAQQRDRGRPGSKTYLAAIAMMAAEQMRSVESVPAICANLNENFSMNAVHALQSIGGKPAALCLEHAMESDAFADTCPVFKALVAMSDDRAVPLAIDRIDGHETWNSYRYKAVHSSDSSCLVGKLSAITGKDFGYDRRRWQEWWAGPHPDHFKNAGPGLDLSDYDWIGCLR
jgi:hypothetical protein